MLKCISLSQGDIWRQKYTNKGQQWWIDLAKMKCLHAVQREFCMTHRCVYLCLCCLSFYVSLCPFLNTQTHYHHHHTIYRKSHYSSGLQHGRCLPLSAVSLSAGVSCVRGVTGSWASWAEPWRWRWSPSAVSRWPPASAAGLCAEPHTKEKSVSHFYQQDTWSEE